MTIWLDPYVKKGTQTHNPQFVTLCRTQLVTKCVSATCLCTHICIVVLVPLLLYPTFTYILFIINELVILVRLLYQIVLVINQLMLWCIYWFGSLIGHIYAFTYSIQNDVGQHALSKIPMYICMHKAQTDMYVYIYTHSNIRRSICQYMSTRAWMVLQMVRYYWPAASIVSCLLSPSCLWLSDLAWSITYHY